MTSQHLLSLAAYAVSLALSPLLLGIINRVKALFAGRRGPPLLQAYFDLHKLLRKGAVYSGTTSWVFQAGPMIGLAAAAAAAALLPSFGIRAPVSFTGDLVLLAYLLALGRFFTIAAALDTGSSFEGMGASREAFFSLLAEPALFLILATLAKEVSSQSLPTLSEILMAGKPADAGMLGSYIPLLAASLFIVLLSENCRIPVDDPNTHLELTMIHEVMVLDHSGPDFAYILYGASIKLWIMTSLLSQMVVAALHGETWGSAWEHALAIGATMLLVTVLVGVVESVMARLRMSRVPQLLVGANALALLGFVIVR